MRRTSSGFTLIELMVTLAIIAILASIAVPSYRDYVTRGRIPDATGNLATKRVQMEQYFQDNRTYVNAPAGATDQNTSNFFNFTTVDPSTNTETRTATAYTLFAVGKNTMTGFTYTVNQANARTTTITGFSSAWNTTQNCWVVRTRGGC